MLRVTPRPPAGADPTCREFIGFCSGTCVIDSCLFEARINKSIISLYYDVSLQKASRYCLQLFLDHPYMSKKV